LRGTKAQEPFGTCNERKEEEKRQNVLQVSDSGFGIKAHGSGCMDRGSEMRFCAEEIDKPGN
jgi:hypothetical protein